MKIRDARAMLVPALDWGARAIWADLGCGTGTFTLALAELIGAGSTIHAIDRDTRALASLPTTHHGAQIIARHSDIETFALPSASLDGVLLANSLHYIRAQATLLAGIVRALAPSGRCILVEYDTETPLPRWVPFPVSQRNAKGLLREAGLRDLRVLATRPSAYGRGPMYSLCARRSTTAHDRISDQPGAAVDER
jgi:ubiquinone/menaquinone biosynthesis C-methylase UbiE